MEEEKRRRREEEIVETALAAGLAAILMSGLKKLLPCILRQWTAVFAVAPPPHLFLLLHLIVASIVLISTHPGCHVAGHSGGGRSDGCKSKRRGRRSSRPAPKTEGKRSRRGGSGGEEDEEGDAEELNARVEAFIAAFRQQLRLDSFSSGDRRTTAGAPSF